MKETPLYIGLRGLCLIVVLTCTGWQGYPQASSFQGVALDDFVVVLDAGHGGHDPGNLGNGYLEKNIALSIVLEAGKVLEQIQGVKVVYTRKDDSFVDLYQRGEIANKAKADLFVSVHCDSHTSNAHGAGTFVLGLHANKQNFEIAKKENSVIYLEDNYETRYAEYDINSPESVIGLTIMQEEFLDQSILLGKLMQDRFTEELGRNDRKVKQAGFIVLHQTFMPSVLVETGFLTNRDEGRYLNSGKGQEEMGRAIATAVLEYRESLGANTAALPAATPDSTPEPAESTPVSSVSKENKASDPEPKTTSSPEPKTASTENTPAPAGAEDPAQTGSASREPANSKSSGASAAAKDEIAQGDQPTEAVSKAVEAVSSRVVFKIQLMAVSSDPDLDPANFKSLSPLSKEKYQSMFRILFGYTKSYDKAVDLRQQAVAKGFSSAYIVAYRDGVRVPVKEVVPQGSK